jgi:hypothetical protein
MLPSEFARHESYLAARGTWQTATTAYSRGDLVRSAESFLGAAAQLKATEPEPLARTFTAGRCMAYENAVRAYSLARRWEDAQVQLTALAGADPGCKHSIEAALERAREERGKTPLPPLWRRLR